MTSARKRAGGPWRPGPTAPRDGRWILAIASTRFYPDGVPVVVRWWQYNQGVMDSDEDKMVTGWSLLGEFPGEQITEDAILKWAEVPAESGR